MTDLATQTAPSVASGAGKIVPVILSGGTGTRLWPVSRESYPKQFWSLISENTLIQDTALRAVGERFAAPLIVCNQEHRFMVAEQLRGAGLVGARIMLEPVGRNSAPAIAVAALLVAETDPDAVMWIMAADASIEKLDNLHAALDVAAAAARAGRFVTFGITPTAPETGFGYIEIGGPLPEVPAAHLLGRFVEKPDLATAEAMVAGGKHLWNSGMFVFTARTLLEEMARFEPAVLAAANAAIGASLTDLDFVRLDPTAFAASPDISIDYAIAERTDRAAVVQADLGWSDVGSWQALWDIETKDAAGNVASGDVLLEDVSNSYVRSDGMLTTVLGVQDTVVVVTEDAVLVMDRKRSQDVKAVVNRLKKAKRPEATTHNRVYRPWGFYESLIQGDRFQVKRIVVTPGQKLSLQKHFHRAEHWVVVAGSALVTRDDEVVLVQENESIYLPLGCVHRLDNPGRIPLTLIEVQSGSYLGEDDIVRIEDTYGRS